MVQAQGLITLTLWGCTQAALPPRENVRAATVCPGPQLTNGIDVSMYQGTIDFAKVHGAGKMFAFVRASRGLTADTTFFHNWPAAKAAGLIRGTYHRIMPDLDATQQADLMLSQLEAAGGLEAGDLPAVMDAEDTNNQSTAVIIQHMKDFLARIESRTGHRPMIYSAKFFFDAIGNPQDFASYPLWVANYNVTCPLMPGGGWTNWKFWQYSSTGSVPGITGAVDLDHFNGTLADLMAFAIPPATDGGVVDAASGGGDASGPAGTGDMGGCSAFPGSRR